jgi:outer membrane protein OmpA-like peptidoglycan-associated protein
MGGGGDELGFQEFASESAELIPQETGKLNTILQGLKRWPEFMLDIEGSVDVKNDTGDLQLLAANRSRIVKAYLVSEGSLEPDRIFLIENSLANVPRKGSRALLYLSDKYRSPN